MIEKSSIRTYISLKTDFKKQSFIKEEISQ
jgi:hypothetical protein